MGGADERRALPGWAPHALLGLLGLLLVALPALVDAFLPSFYLPLATEMLIFGLFALGYDIIMGYTGMVSFGHAAFFGLGAYITGLTMVRLGLPLLPAMLLGALGATGAAAVIGFFSLRLRSVYFALLTFAFSQIFYQLVITLTDLTGGYDGRALSVPMLWGIPDVLALNLRDRATLYYFVLAVVALTFLAMRRAMAAPFGQVLVAIRENELRAATLGYPVARYKQVAFVLSGLIGGLAGSLMVPYQRFISPDLLYWELSGLVIVMVLLGGMGTLWGPVLGAALVVFLRDAFSGLPQPYGKHYLLPVGLIFALLVIFAPHGLAGLLHRRRPPRRASGPLERGELAMPAADPPRG
ncbi:MAG TPA: branched-chain amino acid ABC transporter permease [Chloroflexota bacterium]|jgi:branched-chain amino acid transport system permease protein|nr:branched-chain amino acid ABC transporter permease [Chloroflexota bacterium]